MAEAVGEAAAPTTRVMRWLGNAAVLVPAVGAGLTFAGHGYYERLFGEFGLKPGVIELTPIDLAARGVDVLLFAPFAFIMDHWRTITLPWIPALLLGALLGLGMRWLLPTGAGRVRARYWVAVVNRWQGRSLRWLLAILFVAMGYGAGARGGAYDAAGIQAARQRAVNCYTINGTMVRAILLGLDKDTVALVRPARTIVRSFTVIEVARCPKRPGKTGDAPS